MVLWSDKKRRFGLLLSFTRYTLTEDRFTCETGLLSLKEEDIQLYRVLDVEMKIPLGDRLFGTGTIVLHSSDKTAPLFEVKSIPDHRGVKELIYTAVEKAKAARRIRTAEILDDGDFEGMNET